MTKETQTTEKQKYDRWQKRRNEDADKRVLYKLSQATNGLSDEAKELALELERRGALEGHYVWSEMIQKALDKAWRRGFEYAENVR